MKRSPYPDRAVFIDADAAWAGLEIQRAADEGLPVVLVSASGSPRVLMPVSRKTCGKTASGKLITGDLINELASKAEVGVRRCNSRGRGDLRRGGRQQFRKL